MLDIRAYTAQTPDMDRFLTVDELHAGFERVAVEYPDLATTKRVGSSRLGEPIRMLSIGSGQKKHPALRVSSPERANRLDDARPSFPASLH